MSYESDKAQIVNLQDIKIDTNLPAIERTENYIRQLNGNPYEHMVGEVKVNIQFSDTKVCLYEIMKAYFISRKS